MKNYNNKTVTPNRRFLHYKSLIKDEFSEYINKNSKRKKNDLRKRKYQTYTNEFYTQRNVDKLPYTAAALAFTKHMSVERFPPRVKILSSHCQLRSSSQGLWFFQ